MITESAKLKSQADRVFKQRYEDECRRVNKLLTLLMIAQWFAGIGFAVFYSPLTWIGQEYAIHLHVWVAVLLGGSISGFAIMWTRLYPTSAHTRHVMAASLMLWSALLIHLTGGKIETHFHVFASLAILSIYRDWKVLVTATVVVAIDHFVRGVFYPLSAFGISTESPYRWIEHAAWVVFEVSFLVPGCMRLKKEIYELCLKQVELEHAKETVEVKIEERTHQLRSSNELLAAKTEETQKLALVARYTDNAVIITDADGEIEWVNDGFERITGYSLSETKGRRPMDLLNGPETAPELIEAMKTAIENRSAYDFEMVRYRKNGEPFWMAIEARPIRDQHGEVIQYILIESDITGRVEAEVERQKLNEQLVEASRTAGIAEVATGVLHNVGNVLNSVNVSASVIDKQFRKSVFDKLERVSNLIEENLENFGSFVNDDSRGQQIPHYILKVTNAMKEERSRVTNEFSDLLNNVEHIKEIVAVQQEMAKTSCLKETVYPAKVIGDALIANKRSLENHRVKTISNIPENLPSLVSDKRKMLQILINLISNAKDSVNEVEREDRQITISAKHVEDAIQFEVTDNGLGIAREMISKIFRHGYTTKETGHGFGLHSSANSATEIGGSLDAFSDGVGCGATFRLTVPLKFESDDGQRPRSGSADVEIADESNATRAKVISTSV